LRALKLRTKMVWLGIYVTRKFMSYYVYIVECSDSSFYTGYTKNIRKRLDRHNGISWGGARYTKTRRPVFLAFLEKYNSKKEATQREYQIKQLDHGGKKELINKASKEDILASI